VSVPIYHVFNGQGATTYVPLQSTVSRTLLTRPPHTHSSWDRQVWEWIDDNGNKTILKEYDEIKGNFCKLASLGDTGNRITNCFLIVEGVPRLTHYTRCLAGFRDGCSYRQLLRPRGRR